MKLEEDGLGDNGYVICPFQFGSEPTQETPPTDQPAAEWDSNFWVDQGFYIRMVQAANRADTHFSQCFNCLEEGHRWRECTKTPLLHELQEILDREALYHKGGAGGREGHTLTLKKGTGKATQVKPAPKE